MEYYPDLARRPAYKTKQNGHYYADYTKYREEIYEDCKQRCVYCDITLLEHGGEGFHLDHFRPKHNFDGLVNDPNNLVSSCPKCNLLKSSHWPVNYPEISLVDPFESNRTKLFCIADDGRISSAADGKALYQIKLLSLDRPARVQIRRARKLEKRIQVLLNNLDEEIKKIIKEHKINPMDENIGPRLESCSKLILNLRQLNL